MNEWMVASKQAKLQSKQASKQAKGRSHMGRDHFIKYYCIRYIADKISWTKKTW